MGLGHLLLRLFRAAHRSDKRRAARNRRAAMAHQRAAMAQQRAALQTQRVIVAAQRKLERNDRMRQAEMEKLVRTRLRDQKILDRRAGLKIDPKKYIRTSAEISAEAAALIRAAQKHIAELSGDGRARREDESAADWLARRLNE